MPHQVFMYTVEVVWPGEPDKLAAYFHEASLQRSIPAAQIMKHCERMFAPGYLEDSNGLILHPTTRVRLEGGETFKFVVLTKPRSMSVDQCVDLRPYAGKERDGLKGRNYLTHREATVCAVFNAVMEVGAVMVTAPPQSGKTSLLQLLEKRALRSEIFSFVLYLNMADAKGSLQQALKPYGIDWKSFFAASRKGINGGILLLLDEAQWLYGKEPDFWGAIKMLHQGPLPGQKQTSTLHVVLATSYLCAPADFAGGLVFDWDPSCTVTLDYHPFLGVGLQFHHAEFEEVITSFRKQHWTDALSADDVRQRVIKDTQGQAGLVTGLLDAVAKQLEGKPFAERAFDAKAREFLDSGHELPWVMMPFFNFLTYACAFDEQMAVLGKLLGKKHWNEGICEVETAYWKEAESLYRQGLLTQRAVHGVDYIGFISPLHRRMCEQLDFKAS